MQDKFKMLDALLQTKTAKSLSTPDLVNLAQTSSYHLAWVKSMIDVQQLLHNVVRGKHEAIEAMLKKDMHLIFKRGKVTDCSGREFKHISAFEYALWALDKHMWAKMIAHLPHQNEEDREAFVAQLIAQYNKVSAKGVTYRLHGKTINEKYFDFENTIIKELQTQVDLINAPENESVKAIDKHWREGVGGAQKLLPMHVVDEYSSTELFYPVPKFTTQPKSSKQSQNFITNKNENWFNAASKLAIDFAIYKGSVRYAMGWHGAQHRARCVQYDLVAMKALCGVRTNDFINLKSQLEEKMIFNHQQRVVQS